MRVVLDTNVVVSAFLGKRCAPILALWKQKRFILFISTPILDEYASVLRRPLFALPEVIIEDFLDYVYHNAHFVPPTSLIHLVHQDPSDDKFLDCALQVKTDYLVTGDPHLLNLGSSFQQTKILPPHEFLKLFH
jgi:putative PIN family toxin of toxin-antitoxin system